MSTLQEFKLKFYELMIQYALHNSEYLDVARHYHKIWETPSIKADETGRGKEVCTSTLLSNQRLTYLVGTRTYHLLCRACAPRQ